MTDFLTGPTSPDPDLSHGPSFLSPSDSPDPALAPESTPSSSSSPHRIGKRSALMACGALVLVGATVVGASALTGTSTQLLKGSVSFTDSDGFDGGKSNCSGTGGYSDLESGSHVSIKNGDGKMLATTELGSGRGESWTEVFAALGETMPAG